MATTPKTVRTYPINSVTKDFTIPFEYLARKFVVVTLIGATRRELILNTEYRFSTATTITTTKAWGPSDNFTLIEIRRLTSATERLVDFADGSILRAYDLNISSVQSLHIAEEARDLTADTIGVNNDGNLDARARKIVNLADGTDDGDAVNLRQQKQWAGSALNQAQAAAASAQAAAAQAAASLAQANNSANSATASASYRDTALSYRNQAEAFKNTAGNSQAAAATSESNASKWAANPEDTLVADTRYSSLHYSRKSSASATASATSASLANDKLTAATTQADRAKTEADRAKTEADKLGNMNSLGAALDSVSGTTVTWKGDQVSLSGKHISRSDSEANFTFAKADGTDTIRLVRTADRVVHLYGDVGGDGDRMTWSQTGVTVPKTFTVSGVTTTQALNAASINVGGSAQVKGGTLQVYSASAPANVHLWFYDVSGTTRGIIFAGQDRGVRVQAGDTVCASFAADGGSTFNNVSVGNMTARATAYTQAGIENTGRVASYRSGIPVNSSMYSNCHFMAQTDDGSPPAYGFHRGGSYALALYLAGNELNIIDSGGTNRAIINNSNFMAWMANVMTAEIVGSISFLQNVSGTNISLNGVLAGGNLRYSSHNNVSSAPPGSWRSLGWCNTGGVSIWVRYA